MDASQKPEPRMRHKWFPLVVIAATIAWWIRQAIDARYVNFTHYVILALAAGCISLWYLRFGGRSPRFRRRVVGGLWLAAAIWLILFRPIYNGGMGFFGWQFRF